MSVSATASQSETVSMICPMKNFVLLSAIFLVSILLALLLILYSGDPGESC